MPRFAEDTKVPTSTHTVVGRLSTKGRPDTTLTVTYTSGGIIEFGTLPPQTPFRLTLTGLDSSKTPLWWSYADDTTGSSPVKDVRMNLAPVPDAAGSLLPTSLIWYKGDTLPVPAGTRYTVDGSDPRTSPSARPVLDPKGLAVDSSDTVKIAVRVPGDPALGQPELWSPVETYTFGIDVLDTITSLDTLMLTHWKNRADSILYEEQNPDSAGYEEHYNFTVIPGVMAAGSNLRYDTIPTGMSFGLTTLSLKIFSIPRSPRATIRAMGLVVVPDSFFEIPFPEDSVVDVTVENNGRKRTYAIHLVPQRTEVVRLRFDSITSRPSGLVLDSSGSRLTIELPPDLKTLVLHPYPDSGQVFTIGGKDLSAGDSIELSIGSDTSSQITVLRTKDSSSTKAFVLRINRSVPKLTFRDTTWGVPWRDVAYDTLVDARNGRKYRTVVVGNARWMAENLNFRVDSSFCPLVQADSCSKYGRLYPFSAAIGATPSADSAGVTLTSPVQGICPTGWHLPTQYEWRALHAAVDSSQASTRLRAVGPSWSEGGGVDSVGMRLLPAGYRQREPEFHLYGLRGDAWFWTSSQDPSSSRHAYVAKFDASSAAPTIGSIFRTTGASVRCVEDAAP